MVVDRHDQFNELRSSLPSRQRQAQAHDSQSETPQRMPRVQYPFSSSRLQQNMDRNEAGVSSFVQNQLNMTREELEYRNRILRESYSHKLSQRQNDRSSAASFQRRALGVQSGGRTFTPEDQHRLQRSVQQQQQQQQQQQKRQHIQMQELLRSRMDSEILIESPRGRSRSSSVVSNGVSRESPRRIDMPSDQGNRMASPMRMEPDESEKLGPSSPRRIEVKLEQMNGAGLPSPMTIDISSEQTSSNKRPLELNEIEEGQKRVKSIDPEPISIETTKMHTDSRSTEQVQVDETKVASEEVLESNDNLDPAQNKHDGSDINLLLKAAEDPQISLPSVSNELQRSVEPDVEVLDVDAESINEGQSVTTDQGHEDVTQHDKEAINLMIGLKNIVEEETNNIESQEIIPGYISCIPKLPSEPEYVPKTGDEAENAEDSSTTSPQTDTSKAKKKVLYPIFLDKPKDKWIKTTPTFSSPIDPWWPSNNTIRKERKANRYEEKSNGHSEFKVDVAENKCITVPPSMINRLSNSVEPGVMEKLPHCKIYQKSFLEKNGKSPPEPLFCCQVTEVYCNRTMVCCSICSTWRHVECGGHHVRYSPHSNESEFVPICDRCNMETEIVKMFPSAEKRMKRQRTKHLIGQQATNAVMRQMTYGRQGAVYKWPLGSVPATHITAHTRNVHGRHERYEKQWAEMSSKLINDLGNRSKEKIKSRTKDLQKILLNLEDAEDEIDRRNMILFLENDTMKKDPAGYERNSLLNFFDIEEYDLTIQSQTNDKKKKLTRNEYINALDNDNYNTLKNKEINQATVIAEKKSEDNVVVENLSDDSDSDGLTLLIEQPSKDDEMNQYIMPDRPGQKKKFKTICRNVEDDQMEVKSSKKERLYCKRSGCQMAPRFDSLFCSDGCGVSTMEFDLLHSFEYTNSMHPFQLRL